MGVAELGENTKKLIALTITLLVILSGAFAFALVKRIREKTTLRLVSNESTLILRNNTLVNGVYTPPSNSTQENYSAPGFCYISPINHEIYFMGGRVIHALVMNTTTNLITSTLPANEQAASIAFDTKTNVSYIPIGNYTIALDRSNRVIGNISLPLTSYMLLYDKFNNEFYASSVINYTTSNYNISALNSSFDVIKTIYTGASTEWMAYNSYNHFVYAVNDFSDSVTVIAPNNTIVTNVSVGFLPNHLTVDPYNGWVYVANTGEYNVSVITNDFKTYSSGLLDAGTPDTVTFDTQSGLMAVGYLNGVMMVLDGTHYVGKLQIGKVPDDAVYNPPNGRIYVECASPATVSIVQLGTKEVPISAQGLLVVLLLAVLIAVDAAMIVRLRLFRKKPPINPKH